MPHGKSKRIKPFDSFARVNMWLVFAGYAKLRNPRNKYTDACHKWYRKIALIILFVNAVQHIIYSVQISLIGDIDMLMESFIFTIPMILLIIQAGTLYVCSSRVDKIVELMEDPIFAADNEHDEKMHKENADKMIRMADIVTCIVFVVAFLWIGGPIVKRFQDPNTVINTYLPFHTNTWPRFILGNFLNSLFLLPWVAIGSLNMDVNIATYYAQAHVQLKIINYNLQHLFDNVSNKRRKTRFEYLDVSDKNLQDRFVNYIKRFERVSWFTDEVTSIFNIYVTLQLIMNATCTCLAIYQMSSVDMVSVTFIFNVGYYMISQCKIIVYCYYGGLVHHESEQMINALYQGEWLNVSPRFRRQLLIAMARWIRPITPTVAGIVPLSLKTFLSITRSAYTLFTVLKSTKNK